MPLDNESGQRLESESSDSELPSSGGVRLPVTNEFLALKRNETLQKGRFYY